MSAAGEGDKAKALVKEVVAAVGGTQAFYAARDAGYTLSSTQNGKVDLSQERHLFEGELSWASYRQAGSFAPEGALPLIQFFNGKSTTVISAGEPVVDPAVIKAAELRRRTNFYWFAMMFKLLDPGLYYGHYGSWNHEGKSYDLVKVGFQPGVGKVQDTYLLCVNRETKLVDRFLFTVMERGIAHPFLMEYTYEKVGELMLPTKRRFTQAKSWTEPVPMNEEWAVAELTEVRLNNGWTSATISEP